MGDIIHFFNIFINFKIYNMKNLDTNGRAFMYGSLFTLATILFTGLTVDNFSETTLVLAFVAAAGATWNWIKFTKTR